MYLKISKASFVYFVKSCENRDSLHALYYNVMPSGSEVHVLLSNMVTVVVKLIQFKQPYIRI